MSSRTYWKLNVICTNSGKLLVHVTDVSGISNIPLFTGTSNKSVSTAGVNVPGLATFGTVVAVSGKAGPLPLVTCNRHTFDA